MLDPRQDRVVEDLAHSIAESVNSLGRACTARLLAGIALGLGGIPRQVEEEVAGRARNPDRMSRPRGRSD